MPYNNYNAYGGQNVVNPRANTPAQVAAWNTGWNGYNQIPQQSSDGRVYVNGRAGADAYPIPSYARGQMRNPMNGRYMSDGRSGTYPMYYNTNGMSGRRYYDDEKDNVIHELHRMMESKTDPEVKMAIQDAIRNLEMK